MSPWTGRRAAAAERVPRARLVGEI